jgi:ABC-type nickel/cobalt efflux system permease component RcnA
MAGLDDLLARWAEGHGFVVVVVAAFLLGLRHATDPDHLVAVSTLIASAQERRTRLAARLGAAWGSGHALTLLAFGLPIALFHAYIPEAAQRLAEVLIGFVIVALAVRLLLLWHRGSLHAHEHSHGDERHVHLHSHATSHVHGHAHPPRTARQSFAIGAVHGLAGSAGVTVLLLAAVEDRLLAAVALAVLAAGTAVSMTLLSSGLGSLLESASGRRSFAHAAPALGVLAAAFGTWYAAVALLAA